MLQNTGLHVNVCEKEGLHCLRRVGSMESQQASCTRDLLPVRPSHHPS